MTLLANMIELMAECCVLGFLGISCVTFGAGIQLMSMCKCHVNPPALLPHPGLISLDTVFMTYASLKHVGLNALRLCCNKEARTAVVESAGASILRRLARYIPAATTSRELQSTARAKRSTINV